MPINYRCRHCKMEIGTLSVDPHRVMDQLQQEEFGEIQDYIETDERGNIVVYCICEHCESSLQKFPNYFALRSWLQ